MEGAATQNESMPTPTQLVGQDLAVMQTSNDALITKDYAARLGYFKDDYSQLFLKQKKKMYPIINRGTWARVYSYRSVISRFINAYSQNHETRFQIVSLGAGYDIMNFWIHDQIKEGAFPESVKTNLTYVEVDYIEVIEKKIQSIKKHEQFLQHLSVTKPEEIEHNQINTANYKMISCDLRHTERLAEKMNSCGIDPNAPTLILTECVLVYLKPEESSKILAFISDFFKGDLAFLNYEMINPQDAFGKVMLENLEDRGCRLQGIFDCPNEAAQIKRMTTQAGMTKAECYNMSTVYSRKLDASERHRIEKLEIFDEFEEWDMLQAHYCLCLGKRISSEELDKAIHI